jgi:hypothetical protein
MVDDIKAYDSRKRDEYAGSEAVVHCNGGFYFNGSPIEVTDTALRQLCKFCGIPTDFFQYSLMAEEQTALFNRLYLEKSAGAIRLYRFDGVTLYGVVSDRYRKLDNADFLPTLDTIIKTGLNLRPVKLMLNPDHTKIRLVPEDYVESETAPMIEFTNSENGHGAMKVWAGVYREICSNGLLVEVANHGDARWNHVGKTICDLSDIHDVLNVSLDYMARLDRTRAKYLNNSSKQRLIIDLSEELGREVADRVVETARSEYNSGRTVFEFINSITRAAQYFHARRQTVIERYAATLLSA